jgi:glycosyltransferase involved in cell wall biosynthesis
MIPSPPSVPEAPAITIAICTHNRAKLLRETLQSLAELHWPPAEVCEVLVVLNRCTDWSVDVLQQFADRLPLRWTEVSKLGLSHARNRAICEARGAWIIWTDDDVHVEPDWIQQYLLGMARYPEAGFLGGTIIPRFIEVTPPAWLGRALPYVASAYATRERWEEPLELTVEFLPFGANFAVRREIHVQHFYRTDLGRVGRGWVGGEEEDLFRRLLAHGHRGFWLPRAKVHHLIPPERATRAYLRSYYRGAGKTSLRMEQPLPPPGQLWSKAIRQECLYWLARATGRAEWWIPRLVKSSYRWGQLTASRNAPASGDSHAHSVENSRAPSKAA